MKPTKQELLDCINNLVNDIMGLSQIDQTEAEILDHCKKRNEWFSVIKARRILTTRNTGTREYAGKR